jgi:hypothetical protein
VSFEIRARRATETSCTVYVHGCEPQRCADVSADKMIENVLVDHSYIDMTPFFRKSNGNVAYKISTLCGAFESFEAAHKEESGHDKNEAMILRQRPVQDAGLPRTCGDRRWKYDGTLAFS